MTMHAIAALGLFLPTVFFQIDSEKPGPTLVAGVAVVFFEPTTTEGDSLVRLSGVELADVFDDFDLASGRAAVYVKSLEIPVVSTSKPLILVKLANAKIRVFERGKIPEYIGMILTDGVQEPRLVPGITDERRLIVEINEFFRIR